MSTHKLYGLLIGLVFFTLAGCQTPDIEENIDYAIKAEPKPSDEPPSRYGNQASYIVNGQTYYVKPTSENYVEKGVASWYGKKLCRPK